MSSTTVSAPGKVLLAGGYLVLESPNVGLVIAADKRFYCTVKDDVNSDSNDSGSSTVVTVDSPQFHSVWRYEFNSAEGGNAALIPSSSNTSENAFIEKTLRIALAYLVVGKEDCVVLPKALLLEIRADNDFYTVLPHLSSGDHTPQAVAALRRFLPVPRDPDSGKPIVNKTGLGSSAALVTSICGALLHHFYSSPAVQIIHNLAQVCHCHAQGKIGSGFDVSSAIYGSHVYRRFPKCTLGDLLGDLADASPRVPNLSLLQNVVEIKWSGGVVAPISLHPLKLLLADVCGGSESPSMARQVLTWKATSSSKLWHDLESINPEIIKLVQQVSQADVDACCDKLPCDWPVSSPLTKLKATFTRARAALRAMGEAANVPIEPLSQKALCDATEEIRGVVSTIVPGAGGFDALACLYVESDNTVERIGQLWQKLSSTGSNNVRVCPLAVQAGTEGLRVEHDLMV